jgi:hypothetical protein
MGIFIPMERICKKKKPAEASFNQYVYKSLDFRNFSFQYFTGYSHYAVVVDSIR